MSTISFDLSRSSFDPGWDVDSGIHDALWIQYLQTYSYTANGSNSLLSGTTVPTQGVTFTAAQGDIVFRRLTFADSGGSIGSASATSAAVVTLDWTSSDSATLRLDRAWNTIKNAEVSNFGGTSLRVENFVDAWVHLADDTGRSITIEGAKRAEVATGGGNDSITIGVESNNPGWTNEFLVVSGAGNDVIRYRSSATNYVAGQYRGQWTTTTTRAGDGDDTIYGWGSNDIVDGGAGIDQFILRGRLSGYTITTVAGVTTVVGTSPSDGNEGRDRLVNVERIVDADGTVLLLGTSGAPPNAAPVAGDDTEFLSASGGVLGTVNLTAALLDNDVDPEGQALTVTAVGPATLGSVALVSGAVQFTFGDTAYRALAEGQTATTSFSYTVADSEGLTDTALATITVTGVNDAATITGTSTGAVSEDGTLTAAGSLAVTDADAGQSQFAAPGSLVGTYGSFSFSSSGLWGYTLNNSLSAIQALGAGQSLTDSLTVASLDGTASRAITIAINGVNDASTITGTSTGVVSEDGTLTATGSLAVSDADAGEAIFAAPGSLVGTYGSFSFSSSGLWGYTLNNGLAAIQSLGAGQSLTDSLTVASLDGTASRAINVTINGVNDAATITGTSTGVVSEDGTLTAAGSLAVTDADAGEAIFAVPGSLVGTYGSFSFNTTGLWGYTLNNGLAAIQSLGAGQSLTDSLTVASLDGTAYRAIAITISGVNDAATITGTSTGVVSEDGTLAASGSLAVGDADAGEAIFAAPGSLIGTYGSFSFNTTGLWGYTLNNGLAAIQALGAGQSLTDSLTVASLDGTASRAITITINGVNDAATITGTSTGVVSEDGTLTAAGSLAVTDADDGQSLFAAPGSLVGTYGSFSFNTTGLWGYTLNNGLAAIQALGAGQSLTDSLTVASLDGTASRAITITINGVNDAATITGTSTGVVSEDGTLTAAGSLAVTDADDGQSLFAVPGSLVGTYGSFSFTSSGLWGYTLNNGLAAIQALGAGQSLTDSLTVASLDGTASRAIAITINGVNDALFTEGADWIDFNTISSGSYTPGTDADALGGNDTVVLLNSGNSLQTSSFTGGSGDDNISGSTTAANQNGINILASSTLSGGAGNDTISGSANGINGRGINNSGTIQGDEGVDSIGGADLIIGNGPDGIFNLGMIRGDGGNDTITGATLPDNSPGIHNAGTISGGDGDDTISGTGYGSNVRGIFNSGLISGGAGNDTIQGSAVTGGDGIENTGTISGGDGNDVLIGSKTAALNSAIRNAGRIEMGAGEDIVDALQGGFFFVGTTGIIDMGADNDTLKGFGNGTHIGGSGTDRLVFGAGTGTYVVSNSGATWSIVRGSVTMSVSEFELISFNGGSTFSNLTAGSFIS